VIDATFCEAYPLARRAAQVHGAAAAIASSLPYLDRKDFEQEGLLAFWRSLPQFDSSKASIHTFAERVVANQIASVMRAHRAARRTRILVAIPEYLEHPGARLELRTDVLRVLATLNKDDRRLARLLAEHSPTEVGRILCISRSTVYEGIRRIRIAFLKAGLVPRSASPKIQRPGSANSREAA
jgi:RNA polymerase sigma factor (sigma-70 family)